jgi:hypothetical protein
MKMHKAILGKLFSNEVSKTEFDVRNMSIAGLKQPETIFFIVGHPKSGTTWLSKILNSHPEVCCNYEGHFFFRDDGFLTLSNSLRSSVELRNWAERTYNQWSSDIDKEISVFVKLIVQYYMQAVAEKTGKRIIGDKSPTYQLKEMAELFPDAKVIHILRDGRDVAVSMAFHRSKETDRYMSPKMAAQLDEHMRTLNMSESLSGLPDDFVAHAAKIWREEVTQCMTDGREKFGNNYREVTYEDLIALPSVTVEKLFAFIGVLHDPQTVNECLRKASFKKLSGGREQGVQDNKSFFRKGIAGDWKNTFTEKNLKTFDDISGDLMKTLGYT